MARLNIPYLTFKPLANGGQAAYWQPSPALRRAGWKPLSLGTDTTDAIVAAQARNAEVDRWRSGGSKPVAVKKLTAPATMAHLIARFEAEWMADAARLALHRKVLAPASWREYRYAFKRILHWAEDGRTRIDHIGQDAVEALRDGLLRSKHADGTAKTHRAITILTILRTLFNFAEAKRIIPKGSSPVDGLAIPSPRRRARRIGMAALDAVRAAARDLGRPDVDLGCLLGLWTLQREADLLALGRSNWRELTDMAGDSRRVLAGIDGRVMGLRLKQGKTHTWVEIPATPDLRTAVEAAFAANTSRTVPVTALVADPDEPRATPNWKFQRGFRAAVNHARDRAAEGGDAMLIDQLDAIQFRDLRRTGMCLLRELGLPREYIANLSGHSIRETEDILKTYMPADPRTSAAAIAMTVTRLGQRADAIDAAARPQSSLAPAR